MLNVKIWKMDEGETQVAQIPTRSAVLKDGLLRVGGGLSRALLPDDAIIPLSSLKLVIFQL